MLRIPNNATKYQIQERIADFLPTDESEVSEVLFYFSGHGKQDDLGMHYALFGTEVDKINSTSLNNTEVDDFVRECSPKLTVREYLRKCRDDVAVKTLMDNIHTVLSGWTLEHDLLTNFL